MPKSKSKSKSKSKISVRATLGCSECHWFSSRGNCVKFGIDSKEINSGFSVTTVSHGSFKLDQIKACPIRLTHDDHKSNIIREAALEKARKAAILKMPNAGMVG